MTDDRSPQFALPLADAAADGAPAPKVPHHLLSEAALPHPRDPFDEVVRFAYGFDGYARFGTEPCGQLANETKQAFFTGGALPQEVAGDLDRLRACIWFEARRFIVLEREPDTRSLIYVHRLIDAVREALPAARRPPR